MCGIFGTVNPQRDFIKLFNANRDRGAHLSIFGPSMRLVFDNILGGVWIPTSEPWLLGHVQAPTGKPNADRHPFQFKNWFVAHNGVIHDWKDEITDIFPYETDSSVLPWTIQNSMGETCWNGLDFVKGSFACWAYNTLEKQIYLFSWVNPIYCSSEMFSSVPVDGADALLIEGNVVRWPQMDCVAEFNPKEHPYR